MSGNPADLAPILEHVLLPSDFSEGSQAAFHHALRGSQSEQVLRNGRYPLMTVPEKSIAAGKLA
jgi:hypothetical protein